MRGRSRSERREEVKGLKPEIGPACSKILKLALSPANSFFRAPALQ